MTWDRVGHTVLTGTQAGLPAVIFTLCLLSQEQEAAEVKQGPKETRPQLGARPGLGPAEAVAPQKVTLTASGLGSSAPLQPAMSVTSARRPLLPHPTPAPHKPHLHGNQASLSESSVLKGSLIH